MALVLSPATLKFSNHEVEHAYAAYRNDGAFLTAERNFMRLNGVLYFIFIFAELLRGEFTMNEAFLLKLMGAAIVAGQFLVMQMVSAKIWVRHRFIFIAVFRTVRLMLFLISVPLWISDPTADAKTLFKTAILRTGLTVNVWYALGMPLLFTEHIVLHSIHVVITAVATSRPTCAVILDTPTSRRIFLHVWKCLHQVLMGLAGMPEYLPEKESWRSTYDHLPQCCERLLLVAHLVLAFVLPTLLLWRMEVVSRQNYIREMNAQRRWGRLVLDATWIPDIGRIVVFCVVSTSACWALFMDV